MKLNAYAKINITLDVLGRRTDGYHDLRGIMHAITLADEIELRRAENVRVEFDVPVPEENTVSRAAKLFCERTGLGGAHINVAKRIPEQAGLGGGSADAAAALKGLNALYGTPLSQQELMRIGLQIGADVPFCLMGGCALAEGVGERLTPLPAVSVPLLIVKGQRGVSTAALFQGLTLPLQHPDNDAAVAAAKAGDGASLMKCAFNSLQAPASAQISEIEDYCRRLRAEGAFAAFMTGSGAAVVGAFRTIEEAARALPAFSDAAFAQVCRTQTRGDKQ